MFNNLNPISTSILSEMNGPVGARRLEQDQTLSQRFMDLTFGMKSGLQSGNTSLKPMSEEAKENMPRSLAHRLINDVTSLEKGLHQVMKQNDLNAAKHLDISKDRDGVADEAAVLFEYTNFSSRYFIATNYIHGAGLRTSEELQVFTRGR